MTIVFKLGGNVLTKYHMPRT